MFCNQQDVNFVRNYSKSPTVLLTAKHFTSGGNVAPECNGIVSWIEVIFNRIGVFLVHEKKNDWISSVVR